MADQVTQLRQAVQRNCDIADAQHAGDYTLCIYLLKMREFFRWEKRFPLTANLPKSELGAWIDTRESLWDNLLDQPFCPLTIDGAQFHPFDTEAINRKLLPAGLVYSGGVAGRSIPHFFLADVLRAEEREGFPVLVAADEHARCMAAPPAMMLNKVIFVRRESLRRMLWEKIEEWSWKKRTDAMARAMAHYDFDESFDAALERMTDNETESAILHEVGECLAQDKLGESWQEMLAAIAGTRAELVARAVRDHIADCNATLPRLIAEDNRAALHFYFANFAGMRRSIFPELREAYLGWAEGAPMRNLETLVRLGQERWSATAVAMLERHRVAPENIGAAIAELVPSSCEA
jgi:hypothetical protein